MNSTIVCSLTGKVVEGGGGDAGGLVAMISKVSGEGRVYSKEVSLILSLGRRGVLMGVIGLVGDHVNVGG